jgi:hypothetical protein
MSRGAPAAKWEDLCFFRDYGILELLTIFGVKMNLCPENKFGKYPLISETAASGTLSMKYLASLSFSKRLAFTINPT